MVLCHGQVYLQVNFDLLLDRLGTFSTPYLLVFKLESVPRCSGIFHPVMTNSFVGLYFHFILNSSVLGNKSTIHNPNHDNLNFDILY